MSAAPDIRDWYRQEFAGRAPGLAGAGLPWLAAQRRAAIEQFASRGFPTRKDEDWKYTDVTPLAVRYLRPASGVPVDAAALAPFRFDAWQLVFVDGRFAPALSRLDGLPDGVRLTSLAARLREAPDALEGWLGRHVGAARHGFAALNMAFAEDGAVIEIRRGVELKKPIQLLSVSSDPAPRRANASVGSSPGATEPGSVQHLRHLILLEEGARAAVIESFVALTPGASFSTGVTEIDLAAGSELTHYRLVQNGADASQIDTTHVQQGRDSRYVAHAVTLGGRLLRHELDCALAGEGAECRFNGLTLAHGQAQVDTHTRFDHLAPHTTSREWVRGVLDDEARGVFSGRVVVHPNAQRSDAEQSNRNLLLSPRAEADSRPQLEIYADDVKCAHGAATGSLDPDQLFYLRSRGLEAAHARQLLVYGFAADALARLPFEALRRRVAGALGARLLPGASLEELIR
jgi:Fe-S cluster assembly protein SufD